MELLVSVADKYPGNYLLLGNGYMFRGNPVIYDVALESAGYLMGVVAAPASEAGKFGLVGGADASEMVRGRAGSSMGAGPVNPSIGV